MRHYGLRIVLVIRSLDLDGGVSSCDHQRRSIRLPPESRACAGVRKFLWPGDIQKYYFVVVARGG